MTLSPLLPLWLLIPAGLALIGFTVFQTAKQARGRLARRWAGRAVLVLLLCVLALRPALGSATPPSSVDGGLEVYFIVDTTSSMAAEDHGGGLPRLDGVKADIGAIARALPGAEFALISFDSSAVQRVPLTSDVAALRSAVGALTQEVTGYSAGSSVDAPLELVTRVLGQAEAENPDRARVAYYMGDGEQTAAGEPEPLDAIAPLIDGGAVLGYGTAEGGRMMTFDGYGLQSPDAGYIQDFSSDPSVDAISRIDEEQLQRIASEMDVSYFARPFGASPTPLVAGLTVETPELTTDPTSGPLELYWLLAIPIAGLLFADVLVMGAALRELRPPRRSV
ncbi:MAG TPA: VWA domain-containing protein [Glaciihabitans sp.]|nr:VWA domain-containing protein [Glaciihabitans sp.]